MFKKIVLAVAVVSLLCGCGENKTEKKDENDANMTKVSFGTYMTTVKHDGHEYVVTMKSGGYGCSVDTLHSPNCKCRKEDGK